MKWKFNEILATKIFQNQGNDLHFSLSSEN